MHILFHKVMILFSRADFSFVLYNISDISFNYLLVKILLKLYQVVLLKSKIILKKAYLLGSISTNLFYENELL